MSTSATTFQKKRKLAAIMFTDIVGYTALMQEDEEAATKTRQRHREVFQRQHEKHHGEIIQYYGDGTLSIFTSAVQAVLCAIDIQHEFQEGDIKVPVRIGLHLGDIVHSNTEVYGDGVNVAARIESLGIAGSILLSGKTNDELKNQKQISTQSLGSFELKNIADAIEVFAVSNGGINVPAAADLPAKTKSPSKSIAVLPFVNMSSSKENEFFADGMTEEIINALTRIKELKVTSRTSSFFFKDKNIPVGTIGKELNVSAILEGSIRLAGNRMRITVQLIDVAEDIHFWSETFDRSLEDVFAVQDEISLLIADKLREHLGYFHFDTRLVVAPDVDIESYTQYLRGRYLILTMGQQDIEDGLVILKELVQRQPNYALAHLGIHHGYAMMGTLGFIPAMEAFMTAKPFLDAAIAIDPDLPECRLHLAWISFLQNWNAEEAYAHLHRAFEIRPTVDFYQSMTCVLVAEGKFELALHYIQTAQELDPFSEINYHLKGFILYAQEKYAAAIVQFEKVVSLKPDSQVSLLYLGQALLLDGHADEALKYFQNLSEDKDPLMKLGGLTLVHAMMGNKEEANRGIEKLESALETELMDRALNLLILCKAVMHEHEDAFKLIEKGIANRLPMMVYLEIEPMLKPLREYPKFHELMRKVLK